MIKNECKSRHKIEGDYQEPEFITIVVDDPVTATSSDGKKLYTTYRITTKTTFPEYKSREEFSVRRRYSEFSELRNILVKKVDESPNGRKSGKIPPLPGDNFKSLIGVGRFDPEFIEQRRAGLEAFLNSVANHTVCRFVRALHRFLEDQEYDIKADKQAQ